MNQKVMVKNLSNFEMTRANPLIPDSYYEQWRKAEGIPIISRMIIPDIRADLPMSHWARKGVKGAFVDLYGAEESIDCYILEIPPGEQTEAEKYAFEEEIVVLSGRGATEVWQEGGKKHTFEWGPGSLFSPPINCWRQHSSTSMDEPVRLLVMSNAPIIFNLFRSNEFVFNCTHNFRDRFSDEIGFFGAEGKTRQNLIWESNLVPDIYSFRLNDYSWRGAGGTAAWFDMSGNTLQSHVAQFPVGTYKASHRHGPGAHILILGSEGYTLMWLEHEKEFLKIDWKAGSLFAPPDIWFHQHFNTGAEPARYFAVHYGYWRVVMRDFGPEQVHVQLGHQIQYQDEDPVILETFERELKKKGLQPKSLAEWRK